MENQNLLFIILVVILLVGLLPSWPYSRTWGYVPSGIVAVLCVVLLLWVFKNDTDSRELGSDTRRSMERLSSDVKNDMEKLGRDTKDAAHDLTH